MIMDIENWFTATAGDTPTTTNVCYGTVIWDSGPLASTPYSNSGRDLGAGERLVCEVLISTSALSAATASQINFQLVTASASDLTSATVLVENAAASSSTYVNGYRVRLPFPSSTSAYRRYIGINCQITLGVLSALSYKAYVVKEPDTYKAYAAGFKLDA